MKHEEIIQDLQDLATQLNVTIRYERGDFEGGYCILKDKKILLVNRRLMPTRKASVLATALQEIGLFTLATRRVLWSYSVGRRAPGKRSRRRMGRSGGPLVVPGCEVVPGPPAR